jgi:3-carboxy-cis,cis-muconate cycloisomerase
VIGQSLDSIARRLRHLTATHRATPQMGRTFLQDGRPTTFGFRTATWLDTVLAHIVDLRGQRDGLSIQLGGPVGTNAEYGVSATSVVSALADRLDLHAPDISWHSNRDKVLALAQAVERMAATMGKIGTDLALLASTSISEVSVRSGGSSSMPGKENPIDAIRAVAAASACHGAVAMLSFAPPHQLDRAVGSWHLEWIALPLTLQTAGAAAEAIDDGLASIEVDPESMSSRVTSDPTVDDGRIDTVLESFERVVGS